MIKNAAIFAGVLSAYGLMNLLAAVMTSVALLHIYIYNRHWFMRPSLMVAGLMNLFFQWPLAVYAGYYAEWLPHPFDLALVVHLPVLAALLAAALFPDRALRDTWARLNPGTGDGGLPVRVWAVILGGLGVLVVLFAGVYFAYVPWRCTGLHAMLYEFTNVAIYREISLKMLSHALPRYAYSLLSSALLPVFYMFSALLVAGAIKNGQKSIAALAVFLCMLCLPLLMLVGAKGIAVMVLLQTSLLFFWRAQLHATPARLAAIIVLPMLPAFLFMASLALVSQKQGVPLTLDQAYRACNVALDSQIIKTPQLIENERIAKEVSLPKKPATAKIDDDSSDISSVSSKPYEDANARHPIKPQAVQDVDTGHLSDAKVIYLNVMAVMFRVFATPLMAGSWHIHYTQFQGVTGLLGLNAYAHLVAVPYIDIPNRVGLIYGPVYYGHEVINTISVSTGFVFTNYDYLGISSVILSVIMLLLQDLVILVYRFVSRDILAAFLAVVSMAILRMLQTDVTVVWVSHGYLISMLLIGAAQTIICFLNRRGG